MSVVQTSAYRYVGLSGDSKPTSGTNTGSRFVETDTGAAFVFTGSAWVEVTPQTRAAE